MRPRPSVLLLLCTVPFLVGWFGGASTQERRDVRTFVLETLRKQEGATWDRVGQFLLWSYSFDRSGCELRVSRTGEFSDEFQQFIPMAEAQPVGGNATELAFQCRYNKPCIRYHIANTRESDVNGQPRTTILVMDPDDVRPLQNAFAELHQLCRDPYASEWRGTVRER